MVTAVCCLADTSSHMWWKGGGEAYSLWAADIFTLISILQLKANKYKEQICTSESEFQTLSKAQTDTERICT